MDRKEAIITLRANVIYACENAGFNVATINLVTEALDLAIEALGREIEYGQMVVDYTKSEALKSDEWKYDTTCDAESATTTDCISRADTIKALCQECEMKCVCNHDCTEVAIVKGMPSVSEEEVDYCNNCPYISWDKDCISRQQAIEMVHKYFVDAIDKTPHEIDEDEYDVYTDMKAVNELLKHNKHISKAIKALPPVTPTDKDKRIKELEDLLADILESAQPVPMFTPTEQQEHGRLIDADFLLKETFTVDEEEWTTPEIRAILENAPSVTPTERTGKIND